ncbi:MAG: protein translocase subunit SecD [Deltaproteobacteria bacterium]|nr:protein translocase subunit SecD [Deltaproteobacteria bacterium]
MNQSLIIRGVIILLVVASAAFLALPPKEKVKLGLDLQGGMHLVLEVKTADALRVEAEHDMDNLTERLKDAGIDTARIDRLAGTNLEAAGNEADEGNLASFQLKGVPSEKRDEALEVARDFFGQTWDITKTGEGANLVMKDRAQEDLRSEAVEQAMRTIRNRIDQYGVSEPVIQRQGLGKSERLVLQLPGVEDPERVKELIGKTAFLEFKLADFPRAGGLVDSYDEILRNYGGQVPNNLEILEGDSFDLNGNVIGTRYVAVEKRAAISGRDLKTARMSPGEFNEPVVAFTLKYEKGTEFGDFTSTNLGRGMAVVLDGKVLTSPTIQGKINDQGVIKGNFTREEATDLATSLKSGALPAKITPLEERTVGPALGQDSIDQGLRAGLFGGALVIVAMLVIYMLSGINAVLVLTLNVVLVFAALASFGATLTLPGIAGIILTIGMAVDANVLIFERIREELRAGRTVKAAVSSGFGKALSSILDANVTTLIAAVLLFQFGTGPIRGFAVTLSVGILASVFTAVFVSRWLFDTWLSRRQRVERLSI